MGGLQRENLPNGKKMRKLSVGAFKGFLQLIGRLLPRQSHTRVSRTKPLPRRSPTHGYGTMRAQFSCRVEPRSAGHENLIRSFRNIGSAEASEEHMRPRVVFRVRVSGTLPQRGSLCSPNRVFRRKLHAVAHQRGLAMRSPDLPKMVASQGARK
jgi:hypothetical protein